MEGGAKQQELPVSALYRPHLQQENPSFNSLQQTQALLCFNQCEPAHELDDSQLVGAPTVVAGHAEMDVKQDDPVAESETLTEVKVTDKNAGKRKRGRPPRGQAKPPPPKKKKDEEDVCFICFDGGDLVLCDRRGCPKAYHAACIKRDESFFRSRAKWNCGTLWFIKL
ncbi:Zinc finger CCCH domain-containing protein 44 [Vitis vinifera]|uniref:Zinc finger CCCH domain-containing protein 44 n=1 Tax=Vitis vinifera TaxID=29760 RepID=A0A438K5D0_VITVI|nr:Zinc finger CCCH domain-containing protein 44 [Vitis vinifera]RVX16412.1 Zinc finger CCCH domain-containing protein 44 [Vitis vinifera]